MVLIISCQSKVLESDNLQFAYKSGTCTTQCVSVVSEAVNYYLHNESDVYIARSTLQKRSIELIYMYYFAN